MNAIEQYIGYLSTPREQYNGNIETPARESIIKKFEKINNENKHMSEKATQLVERALEDNRRVLFWSDHHFNHDMLWKNNLRNFTNREDMNNAMLNSMEDVSEDDLVIFGGDLCFYNVNDILHQLLKNRCQKIYIIGNHDTSSNSLINNLNKEFDAVTIAFTFRHNKILENQEFLVSHYPVVNEDLINNQINIHGHTHNYLIGDRHINMCVEHTNYGVKELSDLISEHQERYKLPI